MTSKEKALNLVANHFLISGGKIHEIEVTYKGTAIWKEAIRHALFTVENMILITNNIVLLFKLEDIKKEIEKL